jgi:sugar lactone lactonase YvrE
LRNTVIFPPALVLLHSPFFNLFRAAMKKKSLFSTLLPVLLAGGIVCTVNSCIQDHKIESPASFVAQGPPVAAQLTGAIGITDDGKGNIWITQVGDGTGTSGKVSVITPDGTVHTAITGFASGISPEMMPTGLNHLIYRDGKLYILNGVDDMLYIADVAGFVPGVTMLTAGGLVAQDIGTFVTTEHPNAPDDKDSNPYNLTFGPNGDLFITDAGGNAIVRRDKTTGTLSIYAIFPDYPNPVAGEKSIDAVPTGIAFDGTDFYVTTLTGAPFHSGLASIYKVSGSGPAPVTPVVHTTGFTGLTDITFGPGNKKLIVTEFGFGGAGRIASGENAATTLLTPAITPVDILLSTNQDDTYYVLFYGPGILQKFTAN